MMMMMDERRKQEADDAGFAQAQSGLASEQQRPTAPTAKSKPGTTLTQLGSSDDQETT